MPTEISVKAAFSMNFIRTYELAMNFIFAKFIG